MKQPSKIDHVFVFLEIFNKGGIQSYAKDVLDAYEHLNYRAKVFLLNDQQQTKNHFRKDKLKFYYFGGPNKFLESLSLMSGRRLERLRVIEQRLKKMKFKISFLLCLLLRRPTHVFCGHILLTDLIIGLCKSLKIPYTVLTYGKDVWRTLPDSQREALQQASSIWTISRHTCQCLAKVNQINLQQVKILPCMVDGSYFIPKPKSQELLDKYNLNDAQVLLTVARLSSCSTHKGVDVTIKSLPQILEVFPNVKYLVVGTGDDRPRLTKLAQNVGVTDKVIFAGLVPQKELVVYYQVADAFIMPSHEGFGIVYLEAMCCGKPVLSGDADGSVEPLQDGRLGWRVPHRDVNAVANACIEILEGNDPRCDGNWLREKTLAMFSREKFCEQLANLVKTA